MLIGPGEFWADEGKIASTESELRRSLIAPELFLQAYDRFSAQLTYVSPAAQIWLGERAASLPANYMLMGGNPRIRLIPVGERKIGVVLFPQVDVNNPDALAAAFKAALAAGREAAGEASLIIGVSPWGSEAERAFSEQAEGLYHILLGGGSGYGFGSSAVGQNNGILWSRPDDQGRSVNVIRLLSWPEQAGQVWDYGLNFTADIKLLGADVPSDPIIEGLFPPE